MKTKYAIAASLLVSISAFAQKDELKALKKLNEKQPATAVDVQAANAQLTALEGKIAAATPEQIVEYHYYKGKFAVQDMVATPANAVKSFPVAMENLNKVLELEKSGKKKYTDEIQKTIFPLIRNGAGTLGSEASKKEKYKEAAAYYYAAYQIEPKDPAYLYNASAAAVNGKDYDAALSHYLELDKSGFTGEGTNYSARNVKSGEREYYDKATRDLLVKNKQLDQPKDEKIPSLKGEIVKNIALLYIQKGETEKAKQAMASARAANPDDVNLIIAEADLYLKTKEMDMYKKLIGEAIAKNPTNAELFFNLGVATSATDKAEATKLYERALQINPNYVNANINMGVMALADEQKIVNEMNGLGNSAKDNKRYEDLKNQRNAMYKKSLTYFEKAHKQEPDNQTAISSLYSIYQALEMMPEAKAMKAKMK